MLARTSDTPAPSVQRGHTDEIPRQTARPFQETSAALVMAAGRPTVQFLRRHGTETLQTRVPPWPPGRTCRRTAMKKSV